MTDEPEITATPPDSPISVTGTDHITLIGSNEEDTIEYYRDLLGMPLVLRQPNLDDPNSTHLFFDTGDGRIITFFVTDDRQSDHRPLRNQVGSVHHLSFSIDAEEFVEIRDALEESRYGYNEFDRGIFHSLYTRDHNGLTIELSADKYEIPDDRRGEVLATTQRIREEDGSEFAEDRHLAAALEELGLDAEPADLPDAPTGAGI
ncbi:lactoylglutathione lyase [Halostagnicola sp. A56]|uniref:Catechol 2,3-dioxygenase n=1 Tax=Halostagnicola kamekurae TaxID=619731 RepID=A0A1I6PQ34_9EURY|nr:MULTISPECIES: VOC family protein [Halostagnicola]KDE60074.1 lactoylglutathione lyase [Halostagnicola sp. A56]SFS42333.1 Catechol 2,3-dioxygenase [Halostagnicola kamekurae]